MSLRSTLIGLAALLVIPMMLTSETVLTGTFSALAATPSAANTSTAHRHSFKRPRALRIQMKALRHHLRALRAEIRSGKLAASQRRHARVQMKTYRHALKAYRHELRAFRMAHHRMKRHRL